MRKSILGLMVTGMILSACGGGETNTEANDPVSDPVEETTEQPAEEAVAEGAVEMEVAEIVIEGNDQMKYNLSEMKVKAGQPVKLTLKHVGTMTVEVMGHNWVLLKPGVAKDDFGMEAMSAKETGYIPAKYQDMVIANTDMVGGGEETTIEFTAPEAGSYVFMCSFPGHFGAMHGTFIVE